jgi:RNA recognition motif-containing protein
MNIFVGNLNPETAAEGLRKLFSEFGEIVSAKVIMDNATGMSRGFGFVEMADMNASQDAIDNLDMSYFEGNIISVKEAKQNTTRPGQGGSSSYGSSRDAGPRPFKPRATPRPGGSGYNNNNNPGGYNNNFNRNY